MEKTKNEKPKERVEMQQQWFWEGNWVNKPPKAAIDRCLKTRQVPLTKK